MGIDWRSLDAPGADSDDAGSSLVDRLNELSTASCIFIFIESELSSAKSGFVIPLLARGPLAS